MDTQLSEQIRDICQQGYQLYDQGDFKAAIRRFYLAWNMIPKPQAQWQESGWVLTALGDAYFAKGDFCSGIEALRSALHCPNAADNPFIHLRLGQCLYETEDHHQAQHHFQQVLNNNGRAYFQHIDKKYTAFIDTVS